MTRLVTQRLPAKRGLPEETAELIIRPATKFTPVTETGEKANRWQAMMPLFMMMLLYMGIVGISQMLISNTLEEKAIASTRCFFPP